MKEYGILYAKPAFARSHRLSWLNDCYLTNILPKDIRNEILNLSNSINEKYKDVIIVKMDNRINPGCVTKPEAIEEVSQAIYNGMLSIFDKLTGDNNCIRLVYGVGELPQDWIENKTTTAHEIGAFPIMIKIGRFLDHGSEGKNGPLVYEPGIFKI